MTRRHPINLNWSVSIDLANSEHHPPVPSGPNGHACQPSCRHDSINSIKARAVSTNRSYIFAIGWVSRLQTICMIKQFEAHFWKWPWRRFFAKSVTLPAVVQMREWRVHIFATIVISRRRPNWTFVGPFADRWRQFDDTRVTRQPTGKLNSFLWRKKVWTLGNHWRRSVKIAPPSLEVFFCVRALVWKTSLSNCDSCLRGWLYIILELCCNFSLSARQRSIVLIWTICWMFLSSFYRTT